VGRRRLVRWVTGIVCNPRIEDALADITRRIWSSGRRSEFGGEQCRAWRGRRGQRLALEHVVGAGRDRIARSSCGKTPHHDVPGPGARHLVANYPLVEGRTSNSQSSKPLPLGSGRARSSSLTTWTPTRPGCFAMAGFQPCSITTSGKTCVRPATRSCRRTRRYLVPFTPGPPTSTSLRRTTFPHGSIPSLRAACAD
jgi:hypothetical protein